MNYKNASWEPIFAELFPKTSKLYEKSPSFIKHVLARIMLRRIAKMEG